MEPNNYGHGGASSSNPAAELQALLHALRLGDPSSSLQPFHPAATSSLPLNPHQVLAPPLPPMFQSPPQVFAPPPWHMFQSPPQVFAPPPSHMFQPPPQVLAARTATPDMWRLPMYAPNPSAAARLSASAEEYRRFSPPQLSEVQSPPTLGSGSGSLHPYTPALRRALSADADRPPTTREEVRAHLLHGSTEPYLVMSPVSSAHVVDLLVEGDATVRRRVIACVRPIVHKVMNKRYPLFHALLNACNGRVNELEDIIGAVCNGKGFLMNFDGREDNRWKALKELIRVVARNRSLCKTLIHGLIRKELLMVEREGPAVLLHCFTTLPYEDCSVIFEDTLGAIDEIVTSQFGWECMAVCLENARNGDLEDLEATILTRTNAFATGSGWSSHFLQHALKCGSEQFKARIVDRVAQDVVELSVDKFGCYVVEECFLSSPSMGLQRVLDAFLGLRDDDLAVVVQGQHSNYVIRMLLAAGKDYLPVGATELARRIEALPEVVRNHGGAKRVMGVINKLFRAQPIQ